MKPRQWGKTLAMKEWKMTTGATEALLAERGKQHGDFSDHARISQGLKEVMYVSKNWKVLSPIAKEALEMNMHKVARILSGDPYLNDHWDDIAGYVKLVSNRLIAPQSLTDVPVKKTIGGVGAYGDEVRTPVDRT